MYTGDKQDEKQIMDGGEKGEKGKRKKWWVVLVLILSFTLLGIITVFAFSGWHLPHGKHTVVDGPLLVFISIDGLRHDMLSEANTPNLYKVAQQGIMVPMRPAYPSTTFPNHFTMITGLLPAHHGIIGNIFYDSELGVYKSKDAKSQLDARWLQKGEPVWCGVEREGGRTAVVHYVGAGTVFNGLKPTYPFPFERHIEQHNITDKLLPMIRRTGRDAPNLVVGYYSLVDKMNHRHGPDSLEEIYALQTVDKEIGRIVAHIENMKKTNLVIVSDHGAAKLTNAVKLSELLPDYDKLVIFATCSPVTYIYTRPQDRDRIFKTIQSAIKDSYSDQFTVYTTDTIPKLWRFSGNRRLPSILIQSTLGNTIMCDTVDNTADEDLFHLGGDHGYDPYRYKEMWSCFIAKGPRFKQSTGKMVQDPPGTVDVYRVLAGLLELPVGPDTDSTPHLSNLVLKNGIEGLWS